MIPDFISAIYLWIADKADRIAPWHSWLMLACFLFTLFIATSALLMAARDEPPPPPVLVIGYEAEIEALKFRASTAEANIMALINTTNRVVEAVNKIKSPYLGNLATGNELEQVRIEVKALERELTRLTNIYGNYQTSFNSELNELKQVVEELEEELTAHTDNTTIHQEKGGN